MPYKDPDKQKQSQHESYLRNKEKIVERTRKARAKLRQKAHELLTPCVDCGAFDPRFMDWHHLDPSTKLREVSTLIQNKRSWQIIKEEIEKCICLCANCHRIRHSGH